MGNRAKPRETASGTVSIEIDGRSYKGNYSVRGGRISVTSEYGSKDAKASGAPDWRVPQDGLARLLLHEIIREAKQGAE